MSENIYRKIVEYLKSNPGAMPREIADALGSFCRHGEDSSAKVEGVGIRHQV